MVKAPLFMFGMWCHAAPGEGGGIRWHVGTSLTFLGKAEPSPLRAFRRGKAIFRPRDWIYDDLSIGKGLNDETSGWRRCFWKTLDAGKRQRTQRPSSDGPATRSARLLGGIFKSDRTLLLIWWNDGRGKSCRNVGCSPAGRELLNLAARLEPNWSWSGTSSIYPQSKTQQPSREQHVLFRF